MNEAVTALESVDIMAILELLPHRYPFLMVDRIIAIDGDRSAVGIKNVTANEPHFLGHFPNAPVMPGVLIIEGMAQTAGAICTRATGKGIPQLVYFMTIDNAKFRKPVVPGDRLEYHVVQTKKRGNIWKFDCVAKVDDAKVAEASVSAMLVARDPS
ncbi:MAG: 3-hydroxyacyl-ACP dehydratase FabZ [Aurantimonas endophytica]|jgi:3-hydroxyacyl-[acyl-carrier-protein] dehydratase|uniref:3-hydroxyacyl-ACP dehydratase FabZ n=1 Tax=Aurantimonas endophytica TaxID=1522175 RepID=UPI001605AA3B|nr:3-hydroxyacyl-ACP dehydratase FabZ [Aurantimonas endophytica]MCO6402880.1 3-hydroxyacyl-ACP dehydratase FabZ [Aurantimonas endophytica]